MSFDIIPKEVIQVQLSFLSIKDILKCRLVSKEFKDVIDDNNFWNELINRDFDVKVRFKPDNRTSYLIIMVLKQCQKILEKY